MQPIAIFGITGRMGQTLLRALQEQTSAFTLSGAMASAQSARLGQPAGGGAQLSPTPVTNRAGVAPCSGPDGSSPSATGSAVVPRQ